MLYLITQIWLQLALAFALGGVAAWWWLTRDQDAPGEASDVEEVPRSAPSRVESLRLQLEAARSDARAAREALAARTRELGELKGARRVPADPGPPTVDAGPRSADAVRGRVRAPGPRLPDALVEHAGVDDPEPDDLTRIRGVGPVLAKLLNEMGIHTFREIADWTAEDVDRIQACLPRFPGRIRRDDWVAQAAELDRSPS